METQLLSNPTDPVVDDDGSYAGYSEIARKLDEKEPERPNQFSRQLVERWFKHRDTNSFPQHVRVRLKNGREVWLFKWAEVEAWYWRNRRKASPPAETAGSSHPADPAREHSVREHPAMESARQHPEVDTVPEGQYRFF